MRNFSEQQFKTFKCNFHIRYNICVQDYYDRIAKENNSSITVTSPSNILWKCEYEFC